jgi:drug/metabolite transporter superfamily protein YnfA
MNKRMALLFTAVTAGCSIVMQRLVPDAAVLWSLAASAALGFMAVLLAFVHERLQGRSSGTRG